MSIKYTIMLFVACAIWGDAFVRDASAKLTPTRFQKTMADMPMSDRQKIAQIGYEPYLDSKAFYEIQLKEEEKNLIQKSEARRIQDLANMSRDDYCEIYPNDQENCHQTQPSTPDDTTARRSTTPIRNAINDKSKRGGQCTAPQKGSDYFCNDICTSGKYADTNPAFEKAMITLFRLEGPYISNETETSNYGITQAVLDDARRRFFSNLPNEVINLTREQAEDITYKTFYEQYYEKLPDFIMGDVLIFGYNTGAGTGAKIFCNTLQNQFADLQCNTTITDEQIEKLSLYQGDFREDFFTKCEAYYKGLSTFSTYGNAWLNRIVLTRTNGCHSETTDPLARNGICTCGDKT